MNQPTIDASIEVVNAINNFATWVMHHEKEIWDGTKKFEIRQSALKELLQYDFMYSKAPWEVGFVMEHHNFQISKTGQFGVGLEEELNFRQVSKKTIEWAIQIILNFGRGPSNEKVPLPSEVSASKLLSVIDKQVFLDINERFWNDIEYVEEAWAFMLNSNKGSNKDLSMLFVKCWNRNLHVACDLMSSKTEERPSEKEKMAAVFLEAKEDFWSEWTNKSLKNIRVLEFLIDVCNVPPYANNGAGSVPLERWINTDGKASQSQKNVIRDARLRWEQRELIGNREFKMMARKNTL